MSTIHAVILAGGRGSRLGAVRKADLLIDGQRLLDRVAARFSGISGKFLLSIGRYGEIALPAGAVALADAENESQGPLAGIAAAAQHLAAFGRPDDLLISVAVDTPFLPADYVARLAAISGAAGYASFGETFYPTNAAWRLGPLREALARYPGNAGPRALLRDMAATPVQWSGTGPDPFANLNSFADLLALQRRARELSLRD